MKTVRLVALLLTLALAVTAGLDAPSRAGQPKLGALPAPHPSCGDAALLLVNEDTGEVTAAMSVNYDVSPTKPRILRFRDGRLFCDGYEGASP